MVRHAIQFAAVLIGSGFAAAVGRITRGPRWRATCPWCDRQIDGYAPGWTRAKAYFHFTRKHGRGPDSLDQEMLDRANDHATPTPISRRGH